VNLEIETMANASTVFVRFTGELDITAAERAEQALTGIDASVKHVVIDLRGLEFIDSTGLRILLTADARARDRGARLVIVRGTGAVDRVFKLALLDERLDLVDTPEQAQEIER
jgi:anti-sigma B factor antagonist